MMFKSRIQEEKSGWFASDLCQQWVEDPLPGWILPAMSGALVLLGESVSLPPCDISSSRTSLSGLDFSSGAQIVATQWS